MNKLLINTPQNVNFEYRLASVGSRCIAFAVDYGIILIYYIFIFFTLDKIGVFNGLDSWSVWGLSSLVVLPALFYPLIMETLMEGQTVGKRLMKLKVVKIDGTRATFYQYFIRWISNTVDIFLSFGGIGLAAIILTKKGQRLGDLAADTAVISLKDNLQLKDTLFEEITAEHDISYPEVINLTDEEINEIKEIYHLAYSRRNYKIMQALAAKIEVLLGIKTQSLPEDFVALVIKDHYHVFRQH